MNYTLVYIFSTKRLHGYSEKKKLAKERTLVRFQFFQKI